MQPDEENPATTRAALYTLQQECERQEKAHRDAIPRDIAAFAAQGAIVAGAGVAAVVVVISYIPLWIITAVAAAAGSAAAVLIDGNRTPSACHAAEYRRIATEAGCVLGRDDAVLLELELKRALKEKRDVDRKASLWCPTYEVN